MINHLAKTLIVLFLSIGVATASNPPKVQGVPDTKIKSAAKESAAKAAVKSSSKRPAKSKAQIGAASWYGKSFHGRQTASGEVYDMFQFTAAHRDLPLGTMAKVTNLRNGKWVIVKINDRGPYVGNRIMDVSYGAAQMLNFRARGVERVRIEVVSQPEVVAMADQVTELK